LKKKKFFGGGKGGFRSTEGGVKLKPPTLGKRKGVKQDQEFMQGEGEKGKALARGSLARRGEKDLQRGGGGKKKGEGRLILGAKHEKKKREGVGYYWRSPLYFEKK